MLSSNAENDSIVVEIRDITINIWKYIAIKTF